MQRKYAHEMDVHKYIITKSKPVIKMYTLNFNRSLRYCESCKSYQPRTDKNMVKGWKCDSCKEKEVTECTDQPEQLLNKK